MTLWTKALQVLPLAKFILMAAVRFGVRIQRGAAGPRVSFMPPELEREGDFEIFYFGGQKRYKCNQFWVTPTSRIACQYDTYDYNMLLHHISQPHSEEKKKTKPRPTVIVSPILGPDGDPITYEVSDADVRGARFKEE